MATTVTDRLVVALRALSASHSGGCYLGVADRPLFGGPEQCVLVLGPPRAGKTTGVVVPNVLAATAVVAVSTKRDVLDATLGERRKVGRCLLYDPSGATEAPDGAEIVGWSPLHAAAAWEDAVAIAESMVGAARPGAASGESAHWSERAAALLASLLHAARLGDHQMDEVVSWVNRREPEIALEALDHVETELAGDLLTGIVETDHREQSGIWSTAASVLAAYRTNAALASTNAPPIDFASLIAGNDTLYVVASSEQQRHSAPLIAGLVRELRAHVYRASEQATTRHAPVTLILDELANIAPLHDLPELISEGGSHGLVTLACLQDLTQARARWGQLGEGFLSLFGHKIVLGGLGDVRTLDAISTLAGEYSAPVSTISVSSPFRPSQRSLGTRRQRVLAPDAIAGLQPGKALLIDRGAVRRIGLPPFHGGRSRPLHRLVRSRSAQRDGIGR